MKDFSWLLVSFILNCEIAFLLYGLAIHEWPIVFVAIANLPAEILLGAIFFFPRATFRLVDRIIGLTKKVKWFSHLKKTEMRLFQKED